MFDRKMQICREKFRSFVKTCRFAANNRDVLPNHLESPRSPSIFHNTPAIVKLFRQPLQKGGILHLITKDDRRPGGLIMAQRLNWIEPGGAGGRITSGDET